MNCETTTKQLPLVLYGELSFEEEEAVHEHLQVCAACESEYTKLRHLHRALNNAEAEPHPGLLQQCRSTLHANIAASDQAHAPVAQAPLHTIRRWLSEWNLGMAWKPAAAAALIAIGYFGGQLGPRPAVLARFAGVVPEPAVSRIRFVQPSADGNVRLVVEETRERTLSGSTDDPRIRNLLLTAAREANDPGVRVETVDLLKSQTESAEVRRALLAALQSDANPGVRLKALEALRSSAQDNDTRRVLAQVLLTDENPGVRTQAIDLLTQRREPSMVGVLQELMAREENNYVRLKCQRVLSEMNASAESF